MAIITVTQTDLTPTPTSWEMPESYQALRSPVPRGLIIFAGTIAIPTLVGGNQTNYSLTLTLPTGFAYLPKNFQLAYVSSTLEVTFDVLGNGLYNRISHPGGAGVGEPGATSFNMISPGVQNVAAATGVQVWFADARTPKLLLQGLDTMGFLVTDMDTAADGSVSGTMRHWMEYYVFDVDQVDKWEVNTPIPTISHTGF